jgi:hypothetical protein
MIRRDVFFILFAILITALIAQRAINAEPASPTASSQVAQKETCNIGAVDFSNQILETIHQQIALKNGSFIQKDDLGNPD